MQNVLITLFNVESEGYEAITELKNAPVTEGSIIFEAALIRKTGFNYKMLDFFDIGAKNYKNHTVRGGLIGMCIGILGGPIGMLVGLGIGSFAGMSADSKEIKPDPGVGISIIEQIISKINDDDLVLIALTDEEDETILDMKLQKYDVTIMRSDAVVLAREVEKAQEMQKDMQEQAKRELRSQKKKGK